MRVIERRAPDRDRHTRTCIALFCLAQDYQKLEKQNQEIERQRLELERQWVEHGRELSAIPVVRLNTCVCLSVCLSLCLCICLCACVSVCLSLCLPLFGVV